MKRRDFLKATALSAAELATQRGFAQSRSSTTHEAGVSSNPSVLPRREYGKTGVRLSMIGMGGLLLSGVQQEWANRIVAEAVEMGVNYFDVAPTYGNAEVRLGPALRPYRENAFLACKTTQRQRDGAEAELKRSLERLRTDHVDLYQLHAVTNLKKDVDVAFAKGGAMEVFIEGKRSGRIRYLGFSAHSVEAALAAMDRYDFDSVLFPVNFAADYRNAFSRAVVERAQRKGLAVLALKALARQVWPGWILKREKHGKCWYQPLTDLREAELGLRYTLSQPVTAAIPPGEEPLFRLALELAMRFNPITAAETRELKNLALTLNPIFPKA